MKPFRNKPQHDWLWIFPFFAIGYLGCNGTGGSNPPPTNQPTNGTTLAPLIGNNVLTLSVNGSLCSAHSYLNKPCVSVTICSPGNQTNCQTIDDILLDTGSYGFRIFKSALNSGISSSLVPIPLGGQELAECVHYGDGSMQWGPVEVADLILGNEPPVQVPIQIIDSTYSNAAAYCSNAEAGPASAGFSGILGVGVFKQDCGTPCTTQTNNSIYFTCNGSNCVGAQVPLNQQVQNPIALLPQDNNGLIVELPSVPVGGTNSTQGYLVLGIGTQTNNIPTGVTSLPINPSNGEFTTTFNGTTLNSFLDTGSNGVFFPNPSNSSLPDCRSLNSSLAGWYCPPIPLNLTSVTTGSTGSPSDTIPFEIGNLANLLTTNHSVFVEAGANMGGSLFDWGLPFYLGRNIYVGLQNATSSLGTGPYVAF